MRQRFHDDAGGNGKPALNGFNSRASARNTRGFSPSSPVPVGFPVLMTWRECRGLPSPVFGKMITTDLHRVPHKTVLREHGPNGLRLRRAARPPNACDYRSSVMPSTPGTVEVGDGSKLIDRHNPSGL
jgi:hypothetical protein